MTTGDDILTRIDQAVEDAEGFIEWHGSDDSATWAADGSHQPDELDGDYYAYDQARSHNMPRLGLEQGAGHSSSRPVRVGGARLYINIPRQHGRRLTLEELLDQVRRPAPSEDIERMVAFAEGAGIGLQEWQREFLARWEPQVQALADRAAAAAGAMARVKEHLEPTVVGDDRRPRRRRTGRDAQSSPYPSSRRGR